MMDPAKLKVVELRAELTKRGLDSKGNKPALVKRLKDALEKELKQEIPDTSIADTSTEDLDTSTVQSESQQSPEKNKPDPENHDQVENISQPDSEKSEPAEEKMETETIEESPVQEKVEEPSSTNETIEDEDSQEKEDASIPAEDKNAEQDESETRKSRWNSESDSNKAEAPSGETEEAPQPESAKVEGEGDASKGEKRKRSSASPERSQRKRSKSPIKEDEPPIDNNKVQLNWYDSDLHLQLDKESFLSAKPYHEGAFGLAWAGVRATHGVNSGKVYYEVKVTEELKWEDFSKYHEKTRRDQKNDSKIKAEQAKQAEPDSASKAESQPQNGEESSENVEIKSDDTEMKSEAEKEETPEAEKEETPEAEKEETPEAEKEETPEAEKEKSEINQETPEPTEESTEFSDGVKGAPEDAPADKSEENAAEEPMETEEAKEPEEPLPTHLFRLGWSISSGTLQLGEEQYSYGYESTGKFVTDKQFTDYGITFGVGDVIGSFLNIGDEGLSITYTVNGEVQPEALNLPKSELPEDFVLFPHVLSRNFAFEVNLGSREEAWFEKPSDFADYEFLDKVEDKVLGPVRPESRTECEVILMVGLPASGKTHWVQEYIKENPDKRYALIGNTHLLDRMTVAGEPLKSKYKGRWYNLLEKIQKSLNKLIDIASFRRRNVIIDQTNVFPSAQRRKMRPFEGFKRRAVVVVVGDEEQAKRQSLQEAQGGKDVPDSAVLEMKGNMTLPQKNDWYDEIVYVGLEEAEAKTMVQKYNKEGRDAGFGGQKKSWHRDDRHRWQGRRNDYRGGNYRDRNYHNRYDRGPPRQNWHPQRPGGWNRDRRDARGPPMGQVREWRNPRGGAGGRGRGNRDNGPGQNNSYNRNRNPPNRGPNNWQAPGNWGQGNWSNQGWGQGGWNQGWNANQNQWKYGGGNGGNQGYGGYSNWNYYGQYPQNWSAQNQGGAFGQNQYGQYSQQEWAQYAQQYAQQGQTATTTSATTQSQSTPQK